MPRSGSKPPSLALRSPPRTAFNGHNATGQSAARGAQRCPVKASSPMAWCPLGGSLARATMRLCEQ
eukprot:6237-Alexandrium_andersonii.AAC.1